MVEILIVVALYRKIKKMCDARGVPASTYTAMTILSWFPGFYIVLFGTIFLMDGEDTGIVLGLLLAIAWIVGTQVLIRNKIKEHPLEKEKHSFVQDEFKLEQEEKHQQL